jgi:hypothetical protein
VARGYEYDVFISYPHDNEEVRDWVRAEFHPQLENKLSQSMKRAPRVFLDVTELQVGTPYPDQLRDAHLRSRILVAILTPPYFRSDWCCAEWRAMLGRQKAVAADRVPRVVYGVLVADGDCFPPRSAKLQHKDLRDYTVLFSRFERFPPLYMGFLSRMREVAAELADMIADAPPWDPDWPRVKPRKQHSSRPHGTMPRLQ